MMPDQLHPRVTQWTLSSEISLLMAASPKAWEENKVGKKTLVRKYFWMHPWNRNRVVEIHALINL